MFSCGRHVDRPVPTGMPAGPDMEAGALAGPAAKLLDPCCQDPCRELEDWAVDKDRALRGVEVDSGRVIPASKACVAGDVECTERMLCSW